MLDFDVATTSSSTVLSQCSSVLSEVSKEDHTDFENTELGHHGVETRTTQPTGAMITFNSKCLAVGRGVPSFKKEELDLGKVLGKGGFGVVREVANIPSRLASLSPNLSGTHKKNNECVTLSNRSKIKSSFRRRLAPDRATTRNFHEPPFVVKQVNRADFLTCSPEDFSIAVLDLTIEARILSAMKHPNIINLWGSSMPSEGTFGEEESNFLVLDRLHDTLDNRIKEWKRKRLHKKDKNMRCMSLFKLWQGCDDNSRKFYNGKYVQGRLQDRLRVASHLAEALKYIHSHNIVHRDLKTSNIGFDLQGNVKVFDFGLARELPPEEKEANGRYKLTGRTGSIRYMAPEVYNSMPYSRSADVYSFSIVLWEILSLEKAFAMYGEKTNQNFVRDVIYMGLRPELPQAECSNSVKSLLRCSWSMKIDERPSASDVSHQLHQEVISLGGYTKKNVCLGAFSPVLSRCA